MPAKIIEADLFTTEAKYLAHQRNCITHRSKHMSEEVFKRYPWADIYMPREFTGNKDEPGTIIVKCNGDNMRYVVNMLGQYYPGAPKYDKDSADMRQENFKKCLDAICGIKDLESIAFPWGVGCGAASGNWEHYHGLLNRFADHLEGHAEVLIYKRK